MKRTAIRPRSAPTVFFFVSGQVGSRPDGSPEPELQAQVRLAFDNLNAILSAADCTFKDVVDVTVFIVDPESKFEAIWESWWGVLGRCSAPHAHSHWRDLAVCLFMIS